MPVPVAMKTASLLRLAQGEQSVRAVKLDGRPFRQIAQPVGKKALVYAVEAQIEGSVRSRRRRDGVCAGVFLAIGPRMFDRDKLAGNEAELFCALDTKLEMLGLRRQQNRPIQARRK